MRQGVQHGRAEEREYSGSGSGGRGRYEVCMIHQRHYHSTKEIEGVMDRVTQWVFGDRPRPRHKSGQVGTSRHMVQLFMHLLAEVHHRREGGGRREMVTCIIIAIVRGSSASFDEALMPKTT